MAQLVVTINLFQESTPGDALAPGEMRAFLEEETAGSESGCSILRASPDLSLPCCVWLSKLLSPSELGFFLLNKILGTTLIESLHFHESFF